MTLVSELKGDLCIVTNALRKIKKDDKKIDEEDENEEDVESFLLREITNMSRRNSDTQLDCQKLNQETKDNQYLDPNNINQLNKAADENKPNSDENTEKSIK